MEMEDVPSARFGRPPSTQPPSSRAGMVTAGARPVTQQGLSGMRPMQTAGGGITNRTYRDKRYYISLMQSHINTIREELSVLRKSTADYRTTSLNRLETRKLAEKSARNYSECQEILNTYNIVLDVQVSQEKSDKLVFDTNSLKNQNKHMLNELEALVTQKLRSEEKINALKKEIALEEGVMQGLIDNLSNEDKVKYTEALNENQKSLQHINELEQEIHRYKNLAKMHQKNLTQNQSQHLVLLQNLNRLKSQRDGLLLQLQETLTPLQQREVLVQQVKDDKMDTDALTSVKSSLEKDVQNKTEKLNELEEELNEKNATRLKKHKELRDRDEHMSKFIATFSEKAPAIKEKIISLRQQILLILEHITNSVVDINFEELDNIQSNLNQSSVESFANQHSLFVSRLSRLKLCKEKYKTDLKNLREKRSVLQVELQTLKNPNKTKDELLTKMRIAKDECETLQRSLNTTMAAVTEVERRQSDIENQLMSNQFYQQIRELENRIDSIAIENNETQSALDIVLVSTTVAQKLQEIGELVSQRNEKNIFSMRSKKSKLTENEVDEIIWQDGQNSNLHNTEEFHHFS